MDSLIMSTEDETVRIWITPEQIADVVKMKVSGIICDITLIEGEVAYTASIEDIFLIH